MLKKLLLAGYLNLLVLGYAQASDNDLQLLSRSNIVLEDPELNLAEWRWVREHQRLRLAVWQPMSPPYDITTGLNDYGGINADFLGLIARNLNLKAEVKRYENYAAALEALKAGQADIMAQVGQNQQRAGLILSQPYSENKPVEVINIDTPSTQRVESIAICDGYDHSLLQAHYSDAKIKTYSSNRHALEALAFRHLDLFICDATTTRYLISQSNLMNLSLRPVKLPFNTVGFSFATVEQSKEWIQILNKVLKKIPSGVEVDIHRRWNGGIPLSLSEQAPLYTSLERKWMADHKDIRVAVVAENMPVSWFTPAGQLRGIIVDILTALRLRTGLHFKIQPYQSFEAALQAVEKGESDVVAGAIEESIWQHHLLTTRTWFYNSWVMVGRKQLPPSKQALRIVVQAALAPGHWLSQHEKEQVEVVESWRAGLERVEKGKSDIMIMPLIVANEWLSAPDFSRLKILGSVDTPPMRFSFGTAETLYPLVTILNKALINIPPEDLHAITRNGSSDNGLMLLQANPLLAYQQVWVALATIFGTAFIAGAAYLVSLHRRLREQILIANRAEEANRAKSDFLATMSHEIRTPVSAVSGLLELVLARPQDAAANPQRIQVAFQAAQSLLTLIGNILDVSRIEASKLLLHPERVSLFELFESVAVLFESQARQKGLEFKLEIDSELGGEVLADPLRLRQITSNLLSNAIKFTSSGRVVLRAMNEKSESGAINLRLDVEDLGEGISLNVQQRLFQPFSQDEDRRQAGQGSGLGLYICRRLTEMMGGQISLTSQPGVGTQVTVSLRLPVLMPVADTGLARESVLLTHQSSLPLLIADDNPASRMLLEHQLIHLGYRVLAFASARALLDYLELNPASIVLTDCSMPEMDGFELAEILRSRCPDLYVIGVTADARDGVLKKALAAGMNACLFKPVPLERLAEALKHPGHQSCEEQEVKPFELPPALHDAENARAFLLLQIAELDETLSWLSGYAQLAENEVKSGLHRLRGGLQLLGVADIETLCLDLEQHLSPEGMAKLRVLLLGLRVSLQQRLQTLSNVLQQDGEAGAS